MIEGDVRAPNDRVVISLTHVVLRNRQEGDLYAVQFEELGLTAYGNSTDEALDALKGLLLTCIDTHRKRGTLERFLNGAKVRWYWESTPPQFERLSPSLPVAWEGSARRERVFA